MNLISHEMEEALHDVETYYLAKTMNLSLDDTARKVFEEARVRAHDMIATMRNYNGITHVAMLASPMFQDDAFEETLDSVPHLLGVKNGVVDLRTGALRQREPEDCIYTIVDVEYETTADTALMERVVSQAMADHEGKTRFMQKLLGYAITGEVCEEIFVVFTGSGRNSKGVLTQLLADLLGLMYVDMNAGIISCDRQVANLDAEVSKLKGARVAVFKELNVGERMKKDKVQLLSGGDGIPCCKKYCDSMTIRPRHLCILETNHMPEIDQVIPSIIERLICVHFPVSFTELMPGEEATQFRRQCDPTLKMRLRGAHAGALKWLVDGAVQWYATRDLKRNAPLEVKEFTKEYLLDQDRLQQFLKDGCELGAEKRVGTGAFLDAFNDWAVRAGLDRMSAKMMVPAMQGKGFTKKAMRIEGGLTKGYEGVSVNPLADEYDV
jgi:putative DNA primase/helicase